MKQMALAVAVLAALGLEGAGGQAQAAMRADPVQRALAQLQTHRNTARASSHESFQMRDVIVDADGSEHVRFDRRYAGLPVIGGDLVVHSRAGAFTSMSLGLQRPISISTVPVIDADSATVAAGVAFPGTFSGLPQRQLVVYARGRGPARLAWQVTLQNEDADMTYFVDARTSAILDRWSNRETATGTGRSLYSGDVVLTTNPVVGGYELRDLSRGRSYTVNAATGRNSGKIYTDADNTWGNNTSSDAATAAVDAQYGMATTWDFYKTAFGRNGIANNGKGAYSRVHYGRHYGNAYWSDGCFCMTYGDGDGSVIGSLVSLDIAGHEMSHGVTSRTAGLVYSGESGGLNEATSDIFGSMVEFYANNAQDVPDYLIGEQIIKTNVPGSPPQAALRLMFNPALDGQSANCWYAGIGSLDVHFSSGVANHFFYLLAEGSGHKVYNGVDHTSPTCNNSNVGGIGRSKAQQIWYRALTVYFTSTTDYAGARLATLAAAKDLYGVNSPEVGQVAAAWSAVGVN